MGPDLRCIRANWLSTRPLLCMRLPSTNYSSCRTERSCCPHQPRCRYMLREPPVPRNAPRKTALNSSGRSVNAHILASFPCLGRRRNGHGTLAVLSRIIPRNSVSRPGDSRCDCSVCPLVSCHQDLATGQNAVPVDRADHFARAHRADDGRRSGTTDDECVS